MFSGLKHFNEVHSSPTIYLQYTNNIPTIHQQFTNMSPTIHHGNSVVIPRAQVQSVVFSSAYNSSNNMLVCAPTGAGKTNIALLAVARELLLHMRDGVLHVADFKIVYAAAAAAAAAVAAAASSSHALQPATLRP